MRTSIWKAGALLALAAVVGGAAGSALTTRSNACRGGGGNRPGSDGFVGLLTQELNLTDTQRDTVRAILGRRDAAMDALWDEIRPRVDSLRGVIRAEIAPHLTADQQTKFTALTARLDAERRAKRDKEKGKNH